jgi:iron-sulfur cluster repair protein YtfE (RIC family)
MSLDFTAALHEDRAHLAGLVAHVQTVRAFRHKQEAINELYLSLNAHLDSIEDTVLPLLRRAQGQSLPDSISAHHEELKALMSDVMAHRTNVLGLNKALARLCPQLVLHSERERLFLMPAIDRVLEAQRQARHLPHAQAPDAPGVLPGALAMPS